jgi:hypothetical protein
MHPCPKQDRPTQTAQGSRAATLTSYATNLVDGFKDMHITVCYATEPALLTVSNGTCTADSSTGIISNAWSTAKILASSIVSSVDLAACRWHTDVELDVVYNRGG